MTKRDDNRKITYRVGGKTGTIHLRQESYGSHIKRWQAKTLQVLLHPVHLPIHMSLRTLFMGTSVAALLLCVWLMVQLAQMGSF
jgi:hypothetical protein